MNTRDRAAELLDLTHSCGERGPQTMKARGILAGMLDGIKITRTRRVWAMAILSRVVS